MSTPAAPVKTFLFRQTLCFIRDHRSLWLNAFCLFALINMGLLFSYRYVTEPLSLAAYAFKLSPNHQDGFRILWNAFSWQMAVAFLLCWFAKYVQFYFFGTRFLAVEGVSCPSSGKQFGHFFWKKMSVEVLVLVSIVLWFFVILNLSLFLALAIKGASFFVVLLASIFFVLFVLSTIMIFKVLGRLYVVSSLALFSSGHEIKISWRLTKGKIIRILCNAFALSFVFDLLIYVIPRLHLPPLTMFALEGLVTALTNVVMTAFNVLLLRQLQQESPSSS